MPRPRKKKLIFWFCLLLLLAFGLQNIPGTYTLEQIEERFDLNSPEGKILNSLGRTEVDASLYFKESTRHRISHNAVLEVPADTRLTFYAAMEPDTTNGELILKPHILELRADRPLVFIYRDVTLARARILRLNRKGTLQAVGYYQVLSLLRTASRYQRQREIRRDYQEPTEASVNLSAHFSALEPMVNTLLGDSLPDSFDVGAVFQVQLERVHHLRFWDNHLDLRVDGTVQSAQSNRVSRVFQPGFRAHLGVEVHLPREQLLTEAAIGASLKQIHTLDFKQSNPVFDKMIRDVARSYLDEAQVSIGVAEEMPEITQWPGELYIEDFSLRGEGADSAAVTLRIQWKRGVMPRRPFTSSLIR